MATGVLPICVGEATKLVPFLVGGDKEYEAELRLGVTTDTGDADRRGDVGNKRGECFALRRGARASRFRRRHCSSGRRCTRRCASAGGGSTNSRARGDRGRARRAAGRRARDRAGRLRIAARCACASAAARGRTSARSPPTSANALGVGAHLTSLRRTRVGPFAIGRRAAARGAGGIDASAEPGRSARRPRDRAARRLAGARRARRKGAHDRRVARPRRGRQPRPAPRPERDPRRGRRSSTQEG